MSVTPTIRLKLTYHASGYLKAIHRVTGVQTLATYEQDARGADRSGAQLTTACFMSTTLDPDRPLVR